jgi:cellobiose-specific phosphotransferase system component IIC
MLSFLVHKIFTFYIQGALKFECPNSLPNSLNKVYINLYPTMVGIYVLAHGLYKNLVLVEQTNKNKIMK